MLLLCLEKEMKGVEPKEHHPHSEAWWWGYYAVEMLQCVWNCESCHDEQSHEERRT